MSATVHDRDARRLDDLMGRIDALIGSGEAASPIGFHELRRLNTAARDLARVVCSRPMPLDRVDGGIVVELDVYEARAVNAAGFLIDALGSDLGDVTLPDGRGVMPLESAAMKIETALITGGADL